MFGQKKKAQISGKAKLPKTFGGDDSLTRPDIAESIRAIENATSEEEKIQKKLEKAERQRQEDAEIARWDSCSC